MKNSIINPTIATLVYCTFDNKVLLAKRNKAPFVGHWVAPGGKVELGESPHNCAIRELCEETDLIAKNAILRGVITEKAPRTDWHWLIFAYVVTEFDGKITKEHREGELQWWNVNEFDQVKMPEADVIFIDKLLDVDSPIYQATFSYDSDIKLITCIEH